MSLKYSEWYKNSQAGLNVREDVDQENLTIHSCSSGNMQILLVVLVRVCVCFQNVRRDIAGGCRSVYVKLPRDLDPLQNLRGSSSVRGTSYHQVSWKLIRRGLCNPVASTGGNQVHWKRSLVGRSKKWWACSAKDHRLQALQSDWRWLLITFWRRVGEVSAQNK